LGTLDTTSIFIDNYAITDNEGKYTFTVDAGRDYYARMDCSIGSDPLQTNNVYNLVKNSVAGQSYQYQFKTAAAMPKAKISTLQLSADSLEDFKLIVKYSFENSYSNWPIRYDDITSGYTYLPGTISNPNIFITDEDNYKNLTYKKQFSGISKNNVPTDKSFTFDVPSTDKSWYCIFNSDNALNNYSYLQASFALYGNPLTSVEKITIEANNHITVYPNPVNDNTMITFNLVKTDYVNLDIINSNGWIVKSIVSKCLEEGIHTFNWDIKDNYSNKIGSGLYFIRFILSNEVNIQKLIVIN
jgi:hypothetical protein